MSSEEWVFQISPKVGDALINIRAGSQDELKLRLAEITDLSQDVIDMLQALRGGGTAPNPDSGVLPTRDPVPAAVNVVQQVMPGSSAIPSCNHGLMTFKESKPGAAKQWKAWMCPLGQDAPDRCKPKWL